MSNYNIKKAMTVTRGQFVFSNKVSMEEISALLIEIDLLNDTIKDIPILPAIASRLDEELLRSSIFGTAAIEDNPLTEDEVGELLDKKEDSKTPGRFEKEIINLKGAYEWLQDNEGKFSDKGVAWFNEEVVKMLHDVITSGIEYNRNTPGKYRSHDVKVGNKEHGGEYIPPKILPDIEKLMKEFVSWINSEELVEMVPPVRAALTHYYLGRIHPFGDGNGRTARLIEALILRQAGFKYAPKMLSNFYYNNIDEYFQVFSDTRKGTKKKNGYDVTPFVLFVLRGIVESLRDVKGRVLGTVLRLTLHDYYDFLREKKTITKRQHDLLMLLLKDSESFKFEDLTSIPIFKILYRDVSERTVRRDLDKLVKHNLLKVNSMLRTVKFRVFELNYKVLDRI